MQAIRNVWSQFKNLLRSQYGAFSLTNKQFLTADFSPIPGLHAETEMTLASSTIVGATVDTGHVGLKWVRGRFRLKTLGGQAAGETIRVTIQGSTGAALATPVNIGQATVTMETGDTEINVDVKGWSEAGFQSYAVLINSSGSSRTPVFDVMLDFA